MVGSESVCLFQFLVTVGQHEDKAALVFLKDLSKRGITFQEFVKCLEIIRCQPALNVFNHEASMYASPCRSNPDDLCTNAHENTHSHT